MIKIKNIYTVYAHINKINGKMYIGVTRQELHKRFGKTGNGYKGQGFYTAIQKYGWDNFDHETIASGLTKEEAENFEILLINKLKTRNDKYGYNRAIGGSIDNVPTGKDNPLSKHVYQFSLEGELIKKWDCIGDVKRELGFNDSGIVNCCKGRKETMYGFLWSYTDKCIEYKKSQHIISTKPVLKYNKDGVFIKEYSSIKEASMFDNFNYKTFYNYSNNINRLTFHGFVWGYKDKPDVIEIKLKKIAETGVLKVKQYNLNGEYIKTFDSARTAHNETGLSLRNIYSVCEGVKKSCGGFIWKYE